MNQLEKIKNEYLNEIEKNNTILRAAIKEECDGYEDIAKIKDIQDKIKKFEIPQKQEQGRKIAIKYNGAYEITIYMLLFATISNKDIYFYYDTSEILNTVLIEIFKNVLRTLQLPNLFLYGIEYKRSKLIEKQNEYDSIFYVGDYFEYEGLQESVKKQIKYNNYGYMKMYIDKNNFKTEYVNIMKYSYIHNIMVDFYDTIEELADEAQDTDNIVVFTTEKKSTDKIKHYKNLILNKNPFENYEFSL